MRNRLCTLLLISIVLIIFSSCAVLFTQQEWSENYSLLAETDETNKLMIDGDINTVGETKSNNNINLNNRMNLSPSPEVVITLPEKKVIRKIVIHSDNIKKFNLYADKGGSKLKESDWHLIKESKNVKNGTITLPILYSFPTEKIRLVILGTTDDAALTRKAGAKLIGLNGTLGSGGST